MSFDLQQFRQTRYTQRASNLNGWTASARDIIAAYQCGERDFAHVHVQPSQEPEGDFYQAQLEGASFTYANLAGVNFAQSELMHCNFRLANLQGCDLSDSNVQFACFYDACLQDSNLHSIKANGTQFDSAELQGAVLTHAYLMRADFSGANLAGVDFSFSLLHGAYFGHTTLYGMLLPLNSQRPNFTNAVGIYSAFAPGLSSRTAALYGSVNEAGQLLLHAGCFVGTPQELVARLNEKPPQHQQAHRDRYLAAIQFIETMYQADVQAGIWTVSE